MPSKVLQLRPAAKKPPRRTAKVTLHDFPKGHRRGSNEYPPLTVNVSGHLEMRHLDHRVLGAAAAIAGVRTYTVLGPGLPQEGVRIPAIANIGSVALNRWQALKLPERFHYALLRFHHGLRDALRTSRLHDLEGTEELRQALTLVPEAMRVQEVLTPKVYDDDGNILSATAIARKARHDAFLNAFKEGRLLQPGLIPLRFSDEGVVRLTQEDKVPRAEDSVVFDQAGAAQEVRAMLQAIGIPKMPETIAQYVGLKRIAFDLAYEIDYYQNRFTPQSRKKFLGQMDTMWKDGSELLLAVLEKRLDDAARWHKEHKTLEVLAPETFRVGLGAMERQLAGLPPETARSPEVQAAMRGYWWLRSHTNA